MRETKLSYSFHNPNTVEVTADYLLKLFIEVNREKADEAIRRAAQEKPELAAYLPEERLSEAESIYAN